MDSTLHLIRQAGIVLELRRGAFDVLLDDKNIGKIERQGTIDVPLQNGHHTLQVKEGRFTSPQRSFDTSDGEIISFRCNGSRIWPVYLASLIKTDLALTLTRI